MAIFRIKNNKFEKIREKKFDYEKDLQKLVEQNLEEVFGLEFVSGASNKEFSIQGTHQRYYVDTLAYDPQLNSFVIIEYKKDKSLSVIDQGYAYLSAMLNNKADFILEYNEKKSKNLKRGSIDWSQARVIFVAREFTPYQKGAIAFQDLPIEIWEAQLLEGRLASFTQIKPPETRESISKITKSETIKKVSREVMTFTYEDHFKRADSKRKTMLTELRKKIFSLDENIKEKPVKSYLGYKLNWYNFTTIHVYKNKLKVYVRKNKLKSDKRKTFKRVPSSYQWGKTALWWIDITEDKEIDYIMEAIKESYEAAPDR